MIPTHTEETNENALTKSWPKMEKGSLIAANPSPSPFSNDHLLKAQLQGP